jgi:hypothetical protein
MIRKHLLDCLNFVIYILSAVVLLVQDFWGVILTLNTKIWIASILGLLYIVLFVVKVFYDPNKTLTDGTEGYFKYFRKWYKKNGALSIFCNDLEWMKNDGWNLLDIISNKGQNCDIYLKRKIDQAQRQTLEEAGVGIHLIDKPILTSHRFSIMEDGEMAYMIIGTKDHENNNKIKFTEENKQNNPYIISMAKDLLTYCKDVNNAK